MSLSLLAFGADAVFPGSGMIVRIWSVIVRVVKAIPWQVWLGLAAAVALFITVKTVEHKISAAQAAGHVAGVKDATAAFNAAQAKADAAQRAKNVQLKVKQGSIDKEKTNAFLDAGDAIDRRAAALRLQHDAIGQHPAGLLACTATGSPAGCIAPPAPCDGLSWPVALDALTQAAKLQAQLNAVLDWEDEQDKLAEREAGK